MSIISDFSIKRYSKDLTEFDFNRERLNAVLRNLNPQGTLLEMGVWRGVNSKEIKRIFKGTYYGTDITLDIMGDAKKLFTEVKACDLNTEEIPWEKDSIEQVICTEIIEHILDTDNFLQKIRRVLKSGGKLFISTPNLTSLSNRVMSLIGLQPIGTEVSVKTSKYGNPLRKNNTPSGHIRNFTYRAFKDILTANGFIINKVCSSPMISQQPFRLIESVAGNIFPSLSGNPVIICIKK